MTLSKIYFVLVQTQKREKLCLKNRKISIGLLFCDGIIFNFAPVYFADLGFMEYAKKERKIPVCLECGDKIKYGRMDKKFCCDECKVRHNNKMAKQSRAKRRKVMAKLTRNYMILDQMLRSGINSADITDLISEGFVPDFVTGYHKNRFQADEFSCFDIKYKMTDSRIYCISKIRNVSLNLHVEME